MSRAVTEIGLDISRALPVQGWMGEDELLWLAQRAASHERIVEIGCWKGRSTIALAMNTPGHVWAVDTWKGSAEHRDELRGMSRHYLYFEFTRNTEGISNITPLRVESTAAAAHLSQERFDMIFIDGAHDYESVKADILVWRPLLVDGGLFCGHDYEGDFPGVRQAVDELVIGVERGPGSLWYKVSRR
jgi:SAM-dependent methyltransferase